MPRPKILIVEDDAILATAMRVRLTKLGYRVVGVAQSGEKALEFGKLASPDLVLMDIKLNGGMDGIEASERLLSIKPIPIVYVTAYTDEELLQRAKITEPFGYLVKPFHDRELRIAVEIALYKAATEKRLRESERKYRELAQLMPVSLFELDREGRFTFLNEAGLSSTGCSQEELKQGPQALDLVAPEERDSVGKLLDSVQSRRDLADCPVTFVRRDGSRVPALVYAAPIVRDEEFIGTRGIGIDVTERKEAENALAEAKERWEQTFDAVPDLLMILDTHRKVVQLNQASTRRLGMSKDEAVGKACYELFHAQGRPPAACPNPDYFFCGKEYEGEIEEPRLRGTFHVTISPIYRSGGRPIGTVHIARDVTERKRYEKTLEHMVEEIQQFAYIVSHDLRAPLRNIKGFASLLEDMFQKLITRVGGQFASSTAEDGDGTFTALKREIAESLGFIGSSVTRMDQLIGAILRLARVGYQELSPEKLNTRELVEETLALFAHRIASEGITVTMHGLPDVVADRRSAQQIFANLIANAINYLDRDRPGKIVITGQNLGDGVLFCVEDNGIGIAESHLQRIFNIFDRIGMKDVPGEGMGLAFVRTLVRRHGGRIWCESEPDRGSSFLFTIPVDGPLVA